MLITGASAKSQEKLQPLVLWYSQPAVPWEEALPLGNGTTGAMVYGGTATEHYALNDHTLWSGYPQPGNKAGGPGILSQVRGAIFKGEYDQAGKLWKGMHGPYSARYLPMGDLFLKFDFADTLADTYSRSLDLRDAVARVEFTKDRVNYRRETFISYPDQAMVIRLTASAGKKISFNASLTSKLRYTVRVERPDYLVLTGKAPRHVAHRNDEPEQVAYDEPGGEGMTFEIHLKVITKGGKLVAGEHSIGLQGADEAVVLLTEATSFNGFNKSPGREGKDPAKLASKIMEKASASSFPELKKRHLADYQGLFGRVELKLGRQLSALPTDDRLLQYNRDSSDHGLVALYFQYGRYLMIASSRPGTPPANLQGIWNQLVQPPWGCNYTTNINTEMNYWPAEVTNLAECHQPLFDFMESLAVNGAETARINYGIQPGWLLHHNSDIWAKTSPAGGGDWDPRGAPRWSAWPMGGAWFCRHLWEHYLYTGDRQFLEEKAWPLMKGAAEFCLAWLVKDQNGLLVTNPSSSPENTFTTEGKIHEISMASTMDMSIIRELFSNCLQAGRILNKDPELADRIARAVPKLYPFHIGQYGQLQEWFADWDNPKDNHRHISHLFSLYPGNMITPEYTPELAGAARQTLLHRGDVSTGWSMAWKINWWARLKDGDHALKILNDGLRYIGTKTEVMGGGGTFANLFCAHPPFQIDGNFGGTAGIAEMLVQSHEGCIRLLPALPKEWQEGEARGLAARGGFIVDLKWREGRLTEAVIHSMLGGNCRLQAAGKIMLKETALTEAKGESSNPLLQRPEIPAFVNKPGTVAVKPAVPEVKRYDWATRPGGTYHLTFSN